MELDRDVAQECGSLVEEVKKQDINRETANSPALFPIFPLTFIN